MTINAINNDELYLGPYHAFHMFLLSLPLSAPFQYIHDHTCILCLYLEESSPGTAFVGDYLFCLFFCIKYVLCIYIYIEDWNHVSIPSKCILNTFPTDQLKKGILKQSPPGLQRELEWSTSRSTSPCGSIQVPLPTKGFTVSGED